MKLIKELPEIFEEFAEGRQNAFINVKKIKDAGQPVIGMYCTFFPQELAVAMGAAVVGLCSKSDETIPLAENDLPKNLCPLIKASYGFGKADKCPFFYFSDLVVGETTCDGKKKMYEYMAGFKPVYIMELPNSPSEDGVQFFKAQIIKMKEELERVFGVTITEDDIREAIRIKNAERAAVRDFYSIMKADPAPISGLDLLNTLDGISFMFDKKEVPEHLEALVDKIKKEGTDRGRRPRILITGCPMGGATLKVVKAVEDAGGVVVAYENCTGAKAVELNVDESNPDVYEALARKYVNIGCSCMSPNPNRYRLLEEMVEEYSVDGVIDMTLSACHTYAVETKGINDFLGEKGKPYMTLETDYSQSDVAQINTRVAAFVEML